MENLFKQAIAALEAEIDTVRKKPSTETLFLGKRMANAEGDGTAYQFECHNPSVRFAEEIQTTVAGTLMKAVPVSFDEKKLVLRMDKDLGNLIEEAELEWENDFVLKRTQSQLMKLQGEESTFLRRIERLFRPDADSLQTEDEPEHDGMRNEAQLSAIRKAMKCRTLFIWGPPGTGKTDTLGYIIANYLIKGKKVLFASNTNRAVDIGFLSALNALVQINKPMSPQLFTRFGESALDDELLDIHNFDRQNEKLTEQKKNESAPWIQLLEKREKALRAVKKRFEQGKSPTPNQELELKLIEQKIEDAGGLEELEENLAELSSVNERKELWRKRLVATTLAKVCTSDLFHDLDFDAVVVDESSMANLPYMMVLAAHAKWHLVVVGDPMQLPPIALTDNREARDYLERDIFTTVANAETGEELFGWHDRNPEFTSFFDTQYRLESSLADIISTVFYEGRLKSGKTDRLPLQNGEAATSYHLVNSAPYRPILEQKPGEKGFRPVNLVHQQILEKLVTNLGKRGISMDQIGIIVPFRNVVYDIRNRLYQAGFRDVEVGTIHTFQGREKEYILFDTVMSAELQNGKERHYSVRPLDEEKNGLSVPRLLNVAFSRSSRELVVIADMNHIRRIYGNKFLGRLLERMKSPK
ncbi:MAG: hypothetical protein EA360_07095 [Balneolaceae bacterium]|nr:MAG: hypothetical protein EA360_07095 [Balneolaceae bacterium]